MAVFWLGSDPGVPLEEVNRMPGVAVPKDGRLTPSDAPGFGMEVQEDWIKPFTGKGGSEYYSAKSSG